MNDPEPARALELEVEVAGTPETVWAAIATGPGITAWFVPTEVVEQAGGTVTQDFGPGPELQVTGRVLAWEPPTRFAYGEGADPAAQGLAFEFLVEATDHGTCVVRLVNSGFGVGADWDEQYDGMEHGWRVFLHILSLHLADFAGQPAARVLATTWCAAPSDADALWMQLLADFSIEGDRISGPAGAEVALHGRITLRGHRAIAFRLDGPAPGTGFLTLEPAGDQAALSLWLSLYGPDGAGVTAGEAAGWQAWVETTARAG